MNRQQFQRYLRALSQQNRSHQYTQTAPTNKFPRIISVEEKRNYHFNGFKHSSYISELIK